MMVKAEAQDVVFRRNPFQGGMGISTGEVIYTEDRGKGVTVAIPFRVGWGFPPERRWNMAVKWVPKSQSLSGWDGDFHPNTPFLHWMPSTCRNPFQGGMGISTRRARFASF